MSKEKKVWISLLDYAHVKVHSIGSSYPNLYDYPENMKLQSEIVEKRNLAEYKNSSELEELRKKNRALGEIRAKLDDASTYFKQLPISPNVLWSDNDNQDDLPTKSEYIFKIQGGGIVLNEACANILKQFNLGESTLTPLKIHKLFTDELWLDDTFYFFNFFECREYIIVPQPHDDFEFSPKARTPYYSRKALVLDDNMLVINKSATECDLDLWHDPRFMSSYFMSDNLYQALVEANMHEKWNAHFCKLV